MPSPPGYAFQTTIRLNCDFKGTWTQEILEFAKQTNLWYAIKHEMAPDSDNPGLHLHYASVNEILTSTQGMGGKIPSNYNEQIKTHCPSLRAYLSKHGVPQSMKTTAMRSDWWITEYMRKEGDLVYHKLPLDLLELQPYFSDLVKARDPNPEFSKYKLMYLADKRPLPATPHECYLFFIYHSQIANDLKSRNDVVLRDICPKLAIRINGEIPDTSPFLKAPKIKMLKTDSSHPALHAPSWASTDSGSTLRVCPRCYEPGNDPSNHLLKKGHMYCSDCVKH